MQMSAAMFNAFSTIVRASSSVFCNNARAADCANAPPEPIAMISSSGSMTSPLPEIMNELFVSATHSKRFQPPQAAVGAPVLRELDRGARQIAVLLQLRFEALEQRERVGGAAGEACQHFTVVQAPHLAGVALHHGVP